MNTEQQALLDAEMEKIREKLRPILREHDSRIVCSVLVGVAATFYGQLIRADLVAPKFVRGIFAEGSKLALTDGVSGDTPEVNYINEPPKETIQ